MLRPPQPGRLWPACVQVFLITCDTYDVNLHGSTQQTRYKALLSFEVGKEFLSSADASAVEKAVEAVITPEGQVQAASTKTVELGQTPAQVEGALGKPDKIVNLGAKKIYVYKDLKVVFVDEKVSDVQ
jgi:NAD-dependent oxidoreductase involved in siderophore biosynthesis